MQNKSGFGLFKGTVMTVLLMMLFVVTITGLAYSQTANPADSKVQLFTADQLDQITAPIALYPDELIAHVLPASTVPLEVVQADRYVKDHGGKVSEMPDADWDPSVKALTMFPDVLSMMDKNLDWTETLGSAVINQQNDVMDSIQRLRKKNYNAGNLNNMDHQKVVVEKEVIQIVPSDPQVIYVPQYNPTTVVQAAPSPSGIGLAFATGVMVSNWFNYRTTDWYNHGFIVNPVYIDHYRYPPNSRYYGYYHNDIHRGYPDGVYWKPTPYSRDHYSNRVGNKTNINFGDTNIYVGNKTNVGNKANIGNKTNVPNKTYNSYKPPAGKNPTPGNKPAKYPSNAYKPAKMPSTGNKPEKYPSTAYKPAKMPSTGNKPMKMPEIKKSSGNNSSPFGNIQSRSEATRHSERGSFSRGGGSERSRGGGRKR